MKLVDTQRYHLMVHGQETRFLHIASMQEGVKEYVLLLDRKTKKMHLNRITVHGVEEIVDDKEFEDVSSFVEQRKLNVILTGTPKEDLILLPHKSHRR